MPVFDPALAQFTLLLFLAVLYLPVIWFIVRHRMEQQAAARLAALYALLAAALGFFEAFWRSGRIDIEERAFVNVEAGGALLLSFIMMLVVYVFLRRTTWWVWVGAAIFWGLGFALLLQNAFRFPETIVSIGAWTLTNARLGAAWAMLGWLIFVSASAWALYDAFRQSRQPLYRNRLAYWLPVMILLTANDSMIFFAAPPLGNSLRLGAAALMAYIVMTHYMPDLRQIIRMGLIYAITSLLIAVFYMAAFLFSQSAFHAAPRYDPILLGAGIALLLALFFTPLLTLVRRILQDWLSIDQYDAGRTLHEYSQSISNILDMERLATVAMGIILESMEIERGFLFLVDQESDALGKNTYRLHAIRLPEEYPIPALEMDETSPIVSTLTREGRPLLQYDLDLHPAYRAASPLEREFFGKLNVEVYVPIFAKRKWIGILALGPKLSGNRYTDQDLITLSALANQTAVALENARLVDNLMRLNNELRKARRDLENTNRTLRRLDESKSDFISIASHELRTPLTVIRGYTEMLLEDTSLDPNYRAIVKGIHEGTVRLHEVMDSMFDIAQINSAARQLKFQNIDLGEIVRDVCEMQKHNFIERKQSLTVDLPSLPGIQADPNLIEKLFHHLITNAIKFTPNEGRIIITGQIVQPNGGEFPNGGIEIVVADTGVGVDPTYREIIFTKFYQPGDLSKHSTSKTRFKGGGVGLGLALCKGIVEAHGGRIWVESPGHDELNFPGSRFHFILPFTKPEEGASIQMGAPLKFKL